MTTVDSRAARGPVVRALRQARDMPLAELAATAGVSQGYLSYVERGRKTASQATTRALAAALDVAPEMITGQCPAIRALRQALGIAEVDLAAGAGVDIEEFARIERGIDTPSRDILARLARRLGVSSETLCDVSPSTNDHSCDHFSHAGAEEMRNPR